jgi:flagellar basal body rod protein FlgB
MAQGVKSFYNVEFKVSGAGQVQAKIEGLTNGFVKLDTAMKAAKDNEKNLERALIGTTKYYDQQIKKIEQWRATYANTQKEYQKATIAIDKLQASRDKLTQSEVKAQAPMEGTVAAFRKQIAELRALQQTLAKTPAQYKDFENQIQSVRTKMEGLTGSIRMSKKPNQDMISNAGLAGATLTEFGRTISDLPYGIRGVANNLSQLSTLFVTLVSKTEGGMIPALKGLWKQLNGPLGIVLAFQVVIAAIDYFAGAQDKAKGKTEDLSDELKEQNSVLRDLIRSYIASNDVIEKREGLLSAIKQIDKELYDALKEGNKTEEERKRIAETRNQLIDAEVKAGKERNKINEEQAKIDDQLAKIEKDRVDLKEDLAEMQKNELAYSSQIETVKQFLNSLDKEENELNEKKSELSIKLIGILSNLTQAEDNYGEALGRTNEKSRDYLNSMEELNTSLIQKQIERIEAEEAVDQQSAEKKVGRVNKLQEKLIEIERKARLREAYERGASIFEISQIETYYQLEREILERNTADELISIKKEYFGESHDDLVNYYGTTIEEDEKAAKKRLALAKWAQSELAKSGEAGVADFLSNFEGSDDPKSNKKKDEEKEKQKKEAVRQVQETLNMIEQTSQMFFDAEISREERKTAILNNQLRERLNNEKLTADQRQAINDQIAANDAELQKKRDKVAEKAFKVQKALNIANALVDTYRNGWLAFGSQLQIGDPFSPARAKIAQGLTIAAGLANVAAIASQKFVPSAVTVRGASGATGAAVQPPDFNIVGASGTSQLAEAVRGQLDRPVKAYVVSKDISTSQELERNAVSSATL